MTRANVLRAALWLAVLALAGFALWVAAPTFLLLLVLPLAIFVIALGFWASRADAASISRMEPALQVAAHALTAVGVFAVALLYLEEKQWAPRFEVDITTDVERIPDAASPTAVIQAAVAIKNEGRTPQQVNYIEVGALGIHGVPALDRSYSEDLRATQLYRHQSSRWLEIAPGETEYHYVEVPVSCSWQLVRLIVKVPIPPVHQRKGGEKVLVNERKKLISLVDTCSPDLGNGRNSVTQIR